MTPHGQVKVVGTNGQLSLGKAFAGQMVLVDQLDKGTWIIKTGKFIPESEKWLYQGDSLAKLDKALAWAENTLPKDNFKEISKKIKNG